MLSASSRLKVRTPPGACRVLPDEMAEAMVAATLLLFMREPPDGTVFSTRRHGPPVPMVSPVRSIAL